MATFTELITDAETTIMATRHSLGNSSYLSEQYLLSAGDYTYSTMVLVIGHTLNFLSNENDPLFCTITSLTDLIDQWKSINYELLLCKQDMADRFLTKGFETLTLCAAQEVDKLFTCVFIPKLRRFFKVLNLNQLSNKYNSLTRNEILAGFMSFILEILECSQNLWSSYRNHSYVLLQKKLTVLLTILGDTPFWCIELESVKDCLLELETLAKEAGDFILSCTFAYLKMRNRKFDAGIHSVLKKIGMFMNETLRNCVAFKLLELPESAATSRSSSLRSPVIIDSLLEELGDLMNGRSVVTVGDDVKDQVKTLIEELEFIQNVARDIQMPRATRGNDLKESLVHIREVAYEAEYLINMYVVGRIPTWYLNQRLPIIIRKVKLHGIGLQEIKNSYDMRGLNINNSLSKGVSYEAMRNPELVVESVVIGFEDIRTNILTDLVGGSVELKNICIFGMPGIGKSTIAKKLYNDRVVSDHFDLRAWCVVSQTYEKVNVLNQILINLASKFGNEKIPHVDEDRLGLEIYQSLYGRRYVIIMDDVWDSGILDDMRRYFPDDKNGSRILLTSRVKDVVPTDGIFHEPPFLLESQCFDLLVQRVFTKESCPPELLGIAKRIASNCYGLPLAVVVVAGILANLGMEESTWKYVETNLNSCMSDDPSKYMKILELSYEHLPDHLKPCFLYMGCFLDKQVPKRKIIQLWVAEGFVHKKENQSLEHVAEEYYSDLINRSLLMIEKRKSDGGNKACSIHDLLRDMCIRKAEEETFSKHIYSSSLFERYSHLVLFTSPRETFVALHCHTLTGYLSSIGYYVAQMPLLRVINELACPFSWDEMIRFCSLVHLKYLSLIACEFPMVLLRILGNLEYFYLDSTSKVSVPSTILKMVKLRHVRIRTEAVIEKTCDGSRTMNNLKSFSYLFIRNNEGSEILECSPHLQELKCICDGPLFPDLNSLTELQSLTMKFTSPPKCELREGYFPLTIKKLSLYRTSLPWDKMTVVGSLPNLQVLKLCRCAFNGDEWDMAYGEFQELRYLKLSDVSLKQWNVCSEHFPRLRCLVLEYVRNLEEIPCDLGNIPTLERIEVRYCRYEIERSAIQIEEEQRDYGNEDLKVIITSEKRSKGQFEQDEEPVTEDDDDASESGLEPRDNEQDEIDHEESVTEYKDEYASETGPEPTDAERVRLAWVSRVSAFEALRDANGDIMSAQTALRGLRD